MTNLRIQFTKTLEDDKFKVEAELIESTINTYVFYYKNVSQDELGPFLGVVDAKQLTRMPRWEQGVTPTFGVPYVRHTKAVRMLDTEEDVAQWIEVIKHDVFELYSEVINTEPEVTTYDL